MRSRLLTGVAALDPGVRVVETMLTTQCNMRCRYCDQRRSASRAMPSTVLDAAVRRLVSSKLVRPQLTLYGGEPLLAAPLVRRALDRVREWAPPWMTPDVRIVTNGTRLDEEMSGLLVRREVFITISCDGVPAAQNARSPGSFEDLDELFVRMRREHPAHFRNRVAVKVTLTPSNVSHLAESFRYFLSRGIRTVEIAPAAARASGWSRRQARELDRQLAAVVRLSREEYRRSGRIPFRALRPYEASAPAPGGPACGCGSHGLLFVDVDGRIAPCAAFIPSALPERAPIHRRIVAALDGLHVSAPDLASGLLRREGRARRLRSLRRPADRNRTSRRCSRCPARASCLVCPGATALAGGRVPEFQCDVNRLVVFHRTQFHRRLRKEAEAEGRFRKGVLHARFLRDHALALLP
ncbi:MAG: radical SAM protein [Acidobacteria bacterium]|nr:radical SAM protein [Acidobacteriota bacterium]